MSYLEFELLEKISNKSQDLTVEIILEQIDEAIQNRDFFDIFTVNPEYTLLALKEHEVFKTISNAALILPDGIGLVYAAIAFDIPSFYRFTGADMVQKIIDHSAKNNYRILILGDESAKIAVNKWREQYRGLDIHELNPGKIEYHIHNGIHPNILMKIEDIQPDIILVALPMKAQIAYANHLKEQGIQTVIMGVGGAIDMAAGTRKRAPEWWRQLGIEWLWRLAIEPRRYSRIFAAVIRFPLRIAYVTLRQNRLFTAIYKVFKYLFGFGYEKG